MCRWENFSKINKRGGSNKACSWEIFLKKNKKNSMLIRDFRVGRSEYPLIKIGQKFLLRFFKPAHLLET